MKKSRKRCSINMGRWMSYAAAGAATALAASNDADATIYYSGTINLPVNGSHSVKMSTLHSHVRGVPPAPGSQHIGTFADPGNSAEILPYNLAHAKFAGFKATSRSGGKFSYASRLPAGVNIAGLNFAASGNQIDMAYATFNSHSQFDHAGIGFVAFEFNMGRGEQYGWARVDMNGPPENSFTLVDYAFGSHGQAIATGQTAVPEPASLGLLAFGAAGLLASRLGRKRMVVV